MPDSGTSFLLTSVFHPLRTAVGHALTNIPPSMLGQTGEVESMSLSIRGRARSSVSRSSETPREELDENALLHLVTVDAAAPSERGDPRHPRRWSALAAT